MTLGKSPAGNGRHLGVRARSIAIMMPHLHSGGAERVNINLANEFVARGFNVDMVLMQATGELVSQLDQRVRVIDLKARRILAAFVPLTNYLRLERPAGMIACMWPLTVVAIAAKIFSGSSTRMVVAEHSSWSASERAHERMHQLVLRVTARLFYRKAAAVVSVSKGAAADVARLSGLPIDRVTTIYNPITGGNLASGGPAGTVPESWANGSHAKILAVGRLKPIKDYPCLLSAFAMLRRSVDARLLILGDGDERASLEAIARDLRIQEDVLMPGFSADPAPYYRAADLHVLSSTGEGFGNVIVEALEAGTPVVSTDCPSGPREILANGRFGTLVPVGDPEALAKAMQDALGATHDIDALKARAADFSIAKAADAYLDLVLPDWRQRISVPAEAC